MKGAVKGLIPVKLLEQFREWKAFRRLDQGNIEALRNALSPSRRTMRQVSRVDDMPAPLLKDVSFVVDVGAERGYWSEAVAELLDPHVIVAVEPTPSSIEELRSRLARFPQCRILETAAGATFSTANLHVMADSLWNSLLPVSDNVDEFYQAVKPEREIEVKVVPLDSLVEDLPRIDLLKIDVQGFEKEVFRGAERALAKTSALLLEVNFLSHYEGDSLFVDLHAEMTQRGFYLHRYSSPFYSDQGRILYADAVYLRN